MIPAEEWDDILLYLSNHQALGLACARLERLSGPWPATPQQLDQAMDLACQQGVNEFFLLYLISRAVLEKNNSPAWIRSWLRRNHAVEAMLPGLSFRTAMALRWLALPVPTVGFNGRGEIFKMMLALRKGGREVFMPDWARETLDGACLEAFQKALGAARALGFESGRQVGFYAWPMMDPRGPLIRGESLGLPLAMGMSLLDKGVAWPRTLIATGSIDERGEILPVGGLEAKAQAAAAAGAKMFLYPDDEKIEFPEWPTPALPVKDLAQAMTFAQLMALGLPESSNFRLYYSCLYDADLLLDNFHQIPADLLLWARDRGLLSKLVDMTERNEAFAYLVNMLADEALGLEHKEILASLFSEDLLETLAARSSQDALMVSNWYRCRVDLARQRGDADQARMWENRANKLLRAFGNRIYVFYRTPDHQRCYALFDRQFGRGLEALLGWAPADILRRVWFQKLIFLHLPIKRQDDVSARVFFSGNNLVRALSLNALNLEIDPETGDARDMLNCIHAVYLGLIRAAFVISREAILADQRLQRLLARFLFNLVAEAMDEPEPDRLAALECACSYHFARRFLGLEHETSLAWCAEAVAGQLPEGLRQGPQAERLSPLLHGLGLTPHAEWLRHRLATRLESEALKSLDGVYDHFLGLCVISSHLPQSFLGRLSASGDLGREVEAILLPYLRRIEFTPEVDGATR